MTSLTLPAQAREYVLYQRTKILPKRPQPSRFDRLMIRLGLKDDGYHSFVRGYADEHAETVDSAYFREMEALAAKILPHVPQNAQSVLDIGCGIAGLDLFLFRGLKNPDLHLLDRTATEKQVWYMFEEKGAFYNSLDLAESMLVANGVPKNKVHTHEAPEDGNIPLQPRSIDFVVSTISWGFHYPVDIYVDSVARIISENGVLLIDVRKGTDGERALEQHFELESVEDESKHTVYKATLKR
jgi:SAM-dependent methyltransferase